MENINAANTEQSNETALRERQKRLGQISKLDARDKMTDHQAIRRELNDYGVDNAGELADFDYFFAEKEVDEFKKLFAFLGEDTKENPDVVKEFQQITDKKEQLKFILSSSLSDKIRLFNSESFSISSYNHFLRRLHFQQDFINGNAKVWRRWGGYRVQIPLDPTKANPVSIDIGLKRDALYSAMIGSPELAAVKIATDRINNSRTEKKAIGEAVCLHGFESGIDVWDDGSIGQWADLCDEYKIAFDKISSEYKDDSPGQKEYEAVRKLATWITGAFNYCGQIQDNKSSNCAGFEEAIVAGRLSYGIMRRFRGIRLNTRGWVSLRNIKRFIGKSGYSPKRGSFGAEKARLGKKIRDISELSSGEKEEFLERENNIEIAKQWEWEAKETSRINHKYDKLIEKTRSEERRTIFEQRRQDELQKTKQDASEHIAYFEKRTIDELQSDIESRIKLLSRRIEKRKSLAEKAIELHFRLNGRRERWDDDEGEYTYTTSKYRDCIDWINDAPFSVIKHAHRRMSDGVPLDENYKLAISEIIQKSVNNPEQVESSFQQLFEDIEIVPSERIKNITTLASKLSRYSDELSCAELISMSEKDISGIEKVLTLFSFSDVKKIIESGGEPSLIPGLKHVAEEFGYDLDVEQFIKLTNNKVMQSYYHGDVDEIFASTLQNFSMDEVITTLGAGLDLRLLNHIKAMMPQDTLDFSNVLEYASKMSEGLYLKFYESHDNDWKVKKFVTGYFKLLEFSNFETINSILSQRRYGINELLNAMNGGLKSLDLVVDNPWLIEEYQDKKDTQKIAAANDYPFEKNERAKYSWCSKNAFVYLDGDWGRQTIGKIIYTRLQTGESKTLHGASYWLESFQMSEEAYDVPSIKKQIASGVENVDYRDYKMKLYSIDDERMFLARIVSAPQSIRDRLKLSRKVQNINNLFSAPESMLIYDEITKIYKTDDCNIDRLKDMVYEHLEEFYDEHIDQRSGKYSMWRTDIDSFREKVDEAMNQILSTLNSDAQPNERIGEIAQRLKQYGQNRKTYIDDTTSWLVKHTTTPSYLLTKAWGDRALALSDNTEDNARSINNWQKQKAIRILTNEHPEMIKELGLSKEEIFGVFRPFVDELSRCYGSETTVQGISMYKKVRNPNKIMPAQTLEINNKGQKFTGSVLAFDDPRGMTQGFDTGCCMTLDGVSRDCILSGYRDSNAGFFILYDPDDRLMAHSYFYINQKHPDIVVIDNIEANQGRDSNRIVDLYKEYFTQYLMDRFANDSKWQIRQVNVGTRYGEVAKAQVHKLKQTSIVPKLANVDYTDAGRDQRLLLRLSDEEIERAKRNRQTIQSPQQTPKPEHIEVLTSSPLGVNQLPILQELEIRIYPENNLRQYHDDDFAYSELTQPGAETYSFLIQSKVDAIDEAVGYCLAYKAESETDPSYTGKVVYIADFGIVPESRGGITALSGFQELLDRLDENNIRKVEMDARESTSYRLLTSDFGKTYLEKRGWKVVEHNRTTDFGEGERTIMLCLEKIIPSAN